MEGRALDEIIEALIANDEAAGWPSWRPDRTSVGATYNSLLRDTAVGLSAAGIDNVRFEARVLPRARLDLTIEQIGVARPMTRPSPAVVAELRALTARRVRREPMALYPG